MPDELKINKILTFSFFNDSDISMRCYDGDCKEDVFVSVEELFDAAAVCLRKISEHVNHNDEWITNHVGEHLSRLAKRETKQIDDPFKNLNNELKH